MMARVAIVLIFFSMAAFQAKAQGNKFPKVLVDDFNVQGMDKTDDELDGTDQMDLEFDLLLASKVDRPGKPRVEQVREMFENQRDELKAQAEEAGDTLFHNSDVTVLGGFKFHDLQSWVAGILKYCPRKNKYQCTTKNFTMSCFYHYVKRFGPFGVPGRWEWCCPFYPKIIIKKCACCQCAVLTSQYALVGQCRRRYTWRGFLAVCYRNGAWAYLRYIYKLLPTSCYCRVQKF